MLSFEHKYFVAENFIFIDSILTLVRLRYQNKIGFKCHECSDFSDKHGHHFTVQVKKKTLFIINCLFSGRNGGKFLQEIAVFLPEILTFFL